MVNIPVIAKRELNTYFLSLIAYFVLTVYALLHGLIFAGLLSGQEFDPNQVAANSMMAALTLMVFTVPVITMRLLSEEANSGTIETLLTTPVSDVEIVLGKYIGALIFGTAVLIPIMLECAFLALLGGLDYGPIASALLGLYLVIAQFLAIGLFCSALTRVQLASGILTLLILLGICFLWNVVQDSTSTTASVLMYLAPPRHFFAFVKGVIDSRDLVYFVATTALFLFLSVRVLEMRKWR